MTHRDLIEKAIAQADATTVQCGLEANERVTVTVLGQDVYLAMCAELRRLWAYEETEAWCPSCKDALQLLRSEFTARLRCRSCGWDSPDIDEGMAIKGALIRKMVDNGDVEDKP